MKILKVVINGAHSIVFRRLVNAAKALEKVIARLAAGFISEVTSLYPPDATTGIRPLQKILGTELANDAIALANALAPLVALTSGQPATAPLEPLTEKPALPHARK